VSPLPAPHSTALLVPVPKAEDLVGHLRQEHDPSAAAGVPAHVTVMVPFLPPQELDAELISELRRVLAEVPPFGFRLAAVGWFGRSVLYLAPEPAQPFIKLTELVIRQFGTAPYDGEYDSIVPHLTVAHASDGVELAPVAEQLAGGLPLDCRAEEVWLMESDAQVWHRRRQFPLGEQAMERLTD
jgi:2'-5' RNA ligase